MPVAVSPPRRVLEADSGFPPRPKRIGSGFWLWSASSTMIRCRSFCACIAAAGAPGSTTAGGLADPPVGGQDDLAEPTELEVLGHRQRLGQAHEHALEALEERRRRDRQGHVRRRHAGAGPAHVDGRRRDLGLVLELGGIARDAHDVAEVDVVVVAVEDEQPVGRGRVTVAGGILEVEPAERRGRALVVADDDALGRDRAGDRGSRSAALDGRDGRDDPGTRVGGHDPEADRHGPRPVRPADRRRPCRGPRPRGSRWCSRRRSGVAACTSARRSWPGHRTLTPGPGHRRTGPAHRGRSRRAR